MGRRWVGHGLDHRVVIGISVGNRTVVRWV